MRFVVWRRAGGVLPCAGFGVTHSLNILDFVLWGAGAAVVQIGAYFATTRLIPDAGRELQQNNIAVGALYCALSLAIGVLNAACLVDG